MLSILNVFDSQIAHHHRGLKVMTMQLSVELFNVRVREVSSLLMTQVEKGMHDVMTGCRSGKEIAQFHGLALCHGHYYSAAIPQIPTSCSSSSRSAPMDNVA